MIDRKHSLQVSKRFIKAMRQIIADQVRDINSKSAFATEVGEYQQNIAKIEQGIRYPTIDMIVITCQKFKVNPAWLLLGQGEMFNTGIVMPDISSMSKRLNEIEKMINAKVPIQKKKAS